MTPGLVALCAALICAVAGGVLWRQRNGRMRTVRSTRAGSAPVVPAGEQPAAVHHVSGADLGQPLGERATLVQFSSAFCAPCRATRRILTEVTGLVDGVAHVEIDAESRLDLVRRLGVLKTPTVFVTDSAGRIVKRAAGQPRKPDVLAALDVAISANPIGNDASDISVRPA
jgi:thiol-disulfide isomerase/thioredoxin